NQKQAVFVDITADWCITCQVNKQLVLEREPVLQSFAKADVKLLRADWTRPNDIIADYLLKYDRFGIPFNSLYLPDMVEPVIFSELLVAEKIINLLENRLR
ncbi:MAG: thioredoxin family protein, partial [Candidatus Puniceispirillaceae bacterium]